MYLRPDDHRCSLPLSIFFRLYFIVLFFFLSWFLSLSRPARTESEGSQDSERTYTTDSPFFSPQNATVLPKREGALQLAKKKREVSGWSPVDTMTACSFKKGADTNNGRVCVCDDR